MQHNVSQRVVRFATAAAVAAATFFLPTSASAAVVEPAQPAPQAAPAVSNPSPQALAEATPLPQQVTADPAVLLFTKTAGFRHGNIATGIAAIEQLGVDNGFTVDATEDATVFNEANLANYDAVIFFSTTGNVLDATQQAAFESYIEGGGGFVGIHAASDTEYDWPWYGELVGAYFAGHPAQQTATIVTEDHAHHSTEHLDTLWTRFDEWYNFQSNPRHDVHVLQSLDESTYNPGGTAMGDDHPISWCHTVEQGRSWYTALGHTDESFAEQDFLDLVLGGIETSAGWEPSDCGASDADNYQKVTLDDNTSNPMELDVAPDGRVFYIDRNGDVKIIKTDGSIVTAGSVDPYTGQEFGLIGMELDPDFDTNGWIYLTYSPKGVDLDRVSRFTVTGDVMDEATETVIIEWETQRDQCCHAGGEIEFDPDGNLIIATGDNTNPFASDGRNPIDERDGRSAWDAQGTSGNTNDLRGKVLRVTPLDEGGYSVPDGNLFDEAADIDDKTRPEIYAMGFRNPFRIGTDPTSGHILVADYGPDAGSASATRGPDGRVEWNILDEPGNYGWPYCVGPNTPYNDYDFETSTSGDTFDCENGPTNDSPNNTGLTQLPPAIGAEVWYGKSTTGAPEIGNGGAPMAGDTYVYDPNLDSEVKWPEYWDGKAIFGEWNRTTNGMFSFQLNGDATDVDKINQLFPGDEFLRLMAFDWGPDGALYLIEWGSGFGGNNGNSGIYRIEYVGGDRTPIARLAVDTTEGATPLEVNASADGSYDPDGGEVTYSWDFDGDGNEDATGETASYTYHTPGDYNLRLTVTDDEDKTASSTVTITAGNTAPVVTVNAPLNGGFFSFGDTIDYDVTVTDLEDGTIDCNDVIVQPALGHDEHAHGYEQYTGCSGSFPLPGDEGHIGANIFGIMTATYTDGGGQGSAGPITKQEVIELRLRHTEAEYFTDHGKLEDGIGTDNEGVQTEDTSDDGGGLNIGWISDGDWWSYEPANLHQIDSIDLRYAAASSDAERARVEVRTDSPTGELVGSVVLPGTGGWQNWQTVNIPITPGTTSDGVFFVVRTPGDNGGSLMNVNWLEFNGDGVSANRAPDVTLDATVLGGEVPFDVDFTATATDPNGDAPLTYDWAFGDGTIAADAGPTVSHTYTSAGSFTAVVTVTDPAGASTTASVTIDATEPFVRPCFSGRSDDFLGTELDDDRWMVIRQNQDMRVEDGKLVLPLTATDIYGSNNTDTPNIVLQELPSGAVTISTLVELEAYEAYEQGGLIIYADDDNYVKLVFEGRNTNGENAANRIVQFAYEFDGSPTEINTEQLGADFPDEVHLQLRVEANGDVEGWYSVDGTGWTSFGATSSIASLVHPQMGLFALAGNNRAEDHDASFDYFLVTPDDTAGNSEEPNDEFDGTNLDFCRWSETVRPDSSLYSVDSGALTLMTPDGDIYQDSNGDPANIILQPQPEGDWVIETRVDVSAHAERYQQAGLIVYADDDNYVKFDVVTTNTSGNAVTRNLEVRNEQDASIASPQLTVNGFTDEDVWLRIAKEGDEFLASYSTDGAEWTEFDEVLTDANVAANGHVGIFAIGTNQAAPQPSVFEYFYVAPLVNDETAPDIDAYLIGAFTGEVMTHGAGHPNLGGTAEFTVSGQTAASVELTGLQPEGTYISHLHYGKCMSAGGHYQNEPGGAITPPNELWLSDVVGDPQAGFTSNLAGEASGSGTATWRATSQAQSLMIHSGNSGGGLMIGCATVDTSSNPVRVELEATDDMPGVVYIEYNHNGAGWAEYTAALDISEPGDHTVEFRASDTAGNVSDVGEATFSIREPLTVDLVTDPADPSGDNDWFTTAVDAVATASDASASIDFQIDDGEWTADDDGVLTIDTDGEHTVNARATRVTDVETAGAVTIKVDQTAPTVEVDGVVDGQTVSDEGSISVTASDATSGLDGLSIVLDGTEVSTTNPANIVLASLDEGDHELVVTATDAAGNTTVVDIDFTVAVLKAHTAADDLATTEAAVIIPVLDNDTIETGDVTIVIVTEPVAGQVSVTAAHDGIEYTPNAGACGSDSFTYRLDNGALTSNVATVRITIECEPEPDPDPTPVDDEAGTAQDQPVDIDIVANDENAEHISVVSVVSAPDRGQAVVNADFSVTYTPDSGVCGVDSFGYQLVAGGPTATVIVTVECDPVDSVDPSVEGIEPVRLADTRDIAGGTVPAGQTLVVQVAGAGGVPLDARAVLLNITAVNPSAAGHLTVYRCGTNVPTASTLNYEAGETIANAVLAPVSSDGKVCIYTHADVEIVVDANGVVPDDGSIVPVSPARYLDTRPGGPTFDGLFAGNGIVAGGSTVELIVGGRGSVSSDAEAVFMNVTVTGATSAGHVIAYPCGDEMPNASNLNYVNGQTVANMVITELGEGGKVCLYAHADAHLIVDVNGFVEAGSSLSTIEPSRVLDNRPGFDTLDGRFAGLGKLAGGATLELDVAGRVGIPADAETVVLNVTVVDPSADGHLTVFPCGGDLPLASNINYAAGQTVPNAVIAEIGDGGKVCLNSHADTYVVVDASGFVTAP